MILSVRDCITGFTSLVIIGTILLLIQKCIKEKWLNKLIGRKLLHFSAITTCAFAIHQFENRLLLATIFLGFFFILLWVIRQGWMQVNEEKTYGIALFPLAFALLLFIPAFNKSTIVSSALILAISDALAGISGEYFGKQKIIFLTEKKSWVGFTVFYCSAFIITLFFNGNYSPAGILFCATFALLPALTELFSYRGSDNFTVPVFTVAWALLITNADTSALQKLWQLLFLFTAMAFIAVRQKWLTVSGAVASIWIAVLLYTTGDMTAFIAPGIFLISGSLLSKLNKDRDQKNGRNAKQVFANGITGVVFLVFYKISGQEVYLITSIASFCISMADTVSSEMGVYFRGTTYNIATLKKMQSGLSGGISLAGTAAGFLGACLLVAIAGYFYRFSITTQLLLVCTGILGMFIDSIFGSLLQVKYKTSKGELTETMNEENIYNSGYRWCDNDMVNFLSNLITSLAFLGYLLYRSS